MVQGAAAGKREYDEPSGDGRLDPELGGNVNLSVFVWLAVVVTPPSPLQPAGLTIDHQPVACATAERFPRMEARFRPTENVGRARVVFQGQNKAEWYSVDMKPEGLAFIGVLPQPKSSLRAFRYYIEVVDKALGASRTEEYEALVVEGPKACAGRAMAGALGSASVLLQGPAGAALPAGFASTGVTLAGSAAGASTGAVTAGASGGGGLSGGALIGVVAGAGAAAVGVAVAAGKGGDTASTSTSTTGSSAPPPSSTPAPTPAPTPNPTPAPTPTPVPCPACYAGSWRLQGTFTSVANPPLCGKVTVGMVDTIAPVTINPDGSIAFENGRGTVDAQGNFTLTLAGDAPGMGTCPAGQASGRCTTVNTCSGTGSQGGDTLNIQMDRQ